ncbi:hypothetical protein KM043_012681 [Ampulex compressa]|nr:hypothetical protein KM043_012681 [Ampulex compressa]
MNDSSKPLFLSCKYLDFDNLPETNFSCQGKVIGGYYADVETGCQMFHVCTIGQKDEIMDIKFLCLNGTVFDQETRVCERVDEVDCSKSERFYNLNLELYGNNAVTLSLHESSDDDDEQSESVDEHQQRTTSARPATTTTTTSTTTSRPGKPSTTPGSVSFAHSTGYPQHFQPQPPFPQVHTSQSKSLYDDKNGGYHHQYIFHNGERSNNQATSYQLFSNQGVSSTTVQAPQVHQIRFSTTVSPQIIRNEPSTVSSLFHATSSTIQTLLNSNANSPALINPIFHNHGIASTTEQFSIHSNNPRETSDYREEEDQEQGIRPLEAIQPTNKGKVSKLSISPVPPQQDPQRSAQAKPGQRISGNFLPTPATIETTIRSFYPTPRSSSKSPSQSAENQVAQHIHMPQPIPIAQLKPHQITINLPPPDIQRIVQNPSPLLPSQSRVIVTAKASVSDESGRPLNASQLVTLPLPTIPASYDDYKEGDESFDPFYRDVPKIRKNRREAKSSERVERASRSKRSVDGGMKVERKEVDGLRKNDGIKDGGGSIGDAAGGGDFGSLKMSLMRFRDILFGGGSMEDLDDELFKEDGGNGGSMGEGEPRGEDGGERKEGDRVRATEAKKDSMEDLEVKASKHLAIEESEEEEARDEYEEEMGEDAEEEEEGADKLDAKDSGIEEYVDDDKESRSETEANEESEESREEEVKDKEDTKDSWSLNDEDSDSEEHVEPTASDDTETSKHEDLPKSEESLDAKDKSDDIQAVKKDKNIDSNERTSTKEKSVEDDRVLDIVILDADEYSKIKSEGKEKSESPLERTTSTAIPVLSTTQQVPKPKLPDLKEHEDAEDVSPNTESAKNSNKPRKSDDHADHEEKTENTEETNLEKTIESENLEETITQKPRRKSARIKSPRGKISSRRRQQTDRIENITEKTSTTTTTESVIANLEDDIEQIESRLFDEPESQTSKEVDTRAVDQRSSKSSKSLQNSKGHDSQKDKYKNERKDDASLEIHPNKLEKHGSALSEGQETEEAMLSMPEASMIMNVEGNRDDEDTMERFGSEEEPMHSTEIIKESSSMERKMYSEENTSIEEYETLEAEPTTIGNEEEYDDSTLPTNHKTPATMEFRKSSRQDKSMKFEDFSSKERSVQRQSKSRKMTSVEMDSESQEYSTVKTANETSSAETSSEYRDSTEVSFESVQEVSMEEDYKEPEDPEEVAASVESESSEESMDTREEETEESVEDEERSVTESETSTEGILKFTDEIPKVHRKEEMPEIEETTESATPGVHDYVDDNYEPDNYKVQESSTVPYELLNEKSEKEVMEEKKLNSEAKQGVSADKDKDGEEKASGQKATIDNLAKSEEDPEDKKEETTTAPSTTTVPTSTAVPTTTTASTTTTTTTTVRPTPPKLFKPISARKSYNFIPPTTTPNPVIIKPRLGLYNPKPAKPAKSFNDLAPKPVIRKHPLLARKTTTTPSTTTMEKEATTDFEDKTEAPMITTESSKSEENALESKLEGRERGSVASPTHKSETLAKTKGDQFPSEQRIPANWPEQIIDDQAVRKTFTPYPLSKLSTLEATSREEDRGATEAEHSTTSDSIVLLNIDSLSTTTPPTTSSPQRAKPNEEDSTKFAQEETSTLPYEQATEIASYTTEPPSFIGLTTIASESEVTSKALHSTTSRAIGRKSSNSKRHPSFNCLEKEMYRFYGDTRDCRLFHYCSPGFTSRQVLDIRFVCEEGTVFDEESQSCRHDARDRKCPNKSW